MQTYEGYWENGNFHHYMSPAACSPGRRRAFVTVLDEPEKPTKREEDKGFLAEFDRLSKEAAEEEKELRSAWLKRLDAAIDMSLGEELPDIQRSTYMRAPIDLID